MSYVARVPLLETARRTVRFPPGSPLEVPVLQLDELAAGKFAALVQRSVPRDAFDAASLLDLMPDLLARPAFRLAYVCSIAASRKDCRTLRPPEPRLDAQSRGGAEKGKTGELIAPRPFYAANWLRGLATREFKLERCGSRVKCTAVLAVGFEPTRAFAQRVAKPSRLPVSPRQHLNQQANRGNPKAETREQRNRS